MEDQDNKAATRTKSAPGHPSAFTRIDRGVAAAERWLDYVGTAVLLGLMLMTVTQVTRRHLLNSPMEGYIDYMEMMMVISIPIPKTTL